jgi:hypothetical protein
MHLIAKYFSDTTVSDETVSDTAVSGETVSGSTETGAEAGRERLSTKQGSLADGRGFSFCLNPEKLSSLILIFSISHRKE